MNNRRIMGIGIGLAIILAIGIIVLALSGGDDDKTSATEPIAVTDPWIRPAAAGQNSAAFMTIVNNTDQGERLIRVESDIAEMIELHHTTMEGDVMSMEPVDGIDIPANGSAELKPGEYHVMIMMLTSELTEGQTVTLTLHFESGLEMTVDTPVEMRE
jgi:copper(I)-binding protein